MVGGGPRPRAPRPAGAAVFADGSGRAGVASRGGSWSADESPRLARRGAAISLPNTFGVVARPRTPMPGCSRKLPRRECPGPLARLRSASQIVGGCAGAAVTVAS